ncbi:MAG: DegT/DnrJ/EryC1/StrS family aminotransferase [Oscillospiraceae bacterium]|jgi:dTDP-4-amino-4,6-dideoxygalactose transaminase|nr:DegT/DnrJ/EryC1/StrS family aminotransferase [Oscillospiraceae bacterium]
MPKEIDSIPVARPSFDGSELMGIRAVLESGWVAQGPEVERFEKLIALREGARFGVAASSCTAALQLAIRALGVGKGHDVIVPAFTFIATANAVVSEGATPIFADVDEETFTLSISALKNTVLSYELREGALINPATGNALRLIIPVHLFGLCADIPAVNAIALKAGLLVLEDAACAIGARIGEKGQGTFANPSCLSFHPRKSITTGEGGMVLTDDEALAESMRSLRSHGAEVSGYERHTKKDYGLLMPEFNGHGYNFRMTDVQAAMGIAQAARLDSFIAERRKLAEYYSSLLEDIGYLKIPHAPPGYLHTYQSYVCRVDEKAAGGLAQAHQLRNNVMLALAKRNISTRAGTHALHNTGYYKRLYSLRESDFPAADRCEKLSIALPLFVGMTRAQQELVAKELATAFKNLS